MDPSNVRVPVAFNLFEKRETPEMELWLVPEMERAIGLLSNLALGDPCAQEKTPVKLFAKVFFLEYFVK